MMLFENLSIKQFKPSAHALDAPHNEAQPSILVTFVAYKFTQGFMIFCCILCFRAALNVKRFPPALLVDHL